MYHDVLPRGEDGDSFAVPAHRFDEHLSTIRASGYGGVSLEVALSGAVDRPVAITFDDGTASQVHQAFPRLVQHGMTATFFVVTDWVGRPGYATWDDLRRLKDEGMEIGSHTHRHPFLSELDVHEVEAELRRSREILNTRLAQETRTLALPGGDFPSGSARGAISETGYDIVATSVFGRNPFSPQGGASPRFVRRCTVRGDADAGLIEQALAGERHLFLRRTIREGLLRNLRRGLGPSRYARWRRRFFNAIG